MINGLAHLIVFVVRVNNRIPPPTTGQGHQYFATYVLAGNPTGRGLLRDALIARITEGTTQGVGSRRARRPRPTGTQKTKREGGLPARCHPGRKHSLCTFR